MICPVCGTANDAGATFCVKCRTYLAWGSSFEAPPVAPPGAPPPPASPSSDPTGGRSGAEAGPAAPPQGARRRRRMAADEPAASDEPMSRAQRASYLFVEPSGRPLPPRPSDEEAGVEVTMSPTDFSVVPGQQVTTELRVANAGSVVDQYTLAVEGDAAAWATIDPASVNLYPDSDPAVVEVTFSPPRDPGTHPGAVRVIVRATSRADPAVSSAAQGFLRVAPYVDVTSDLLPGRTTGRRRASHDLVVTNRGNDIVSVPVTAADPNELLDFQVAPALLSPGPGEHESAQLNLRARKWLWTGAPQVRPFKASINPPGADPQSLDGQFRQTPVLPKWVVRLAVILIPLLVLAFAYFAATSSVPSVTGRPQAAAMALLSNHGFNPKVVNEGSDTVPAGNVVSTDPGAGSRKKRGSTVDVFVSQGKNPIPVPNVVGLDLPQATAKLTDLGFVVIDMDQASSSTASGLVISTSPAAPTQLQPGSSVTLQVSTGPTGATGPAGGTIPGGGTGSGGSGSGSGSGGSGSGGGSGGGSGSGSGGSSGPPTLVASSAVALPSQLLTTTSPVQSLTIANQGPTTLTVTSLSMGGANAGDFAVTNDGCTGIPVVAGASCTIGITFTPTAAGARTAALSVISNATGSPHLIALSGTGLAPSLSVNPLNLDFSPQQAGTSSPPQSIVITNSGNGPLTVGSVVVGGRNTSDFHKTGDTCSGASVAPLASCSIAIAFEPAPAATSPSSSTGTLTLTTSAGGGTQVVVTLAGTAVSPSLKLSSDELQINTLAGVGGQATLTISNGGSLAVNMGDPYLIGGGTALTLTTTCKGSLAPGASCAITVTNGVTPVGSCPPAVVDIPDDAPVPGSNQQVPVVLEGAGC